MITSKKTDGTYGEIGFIKVKQEDGSYKDIEYQYDNKGNLIFEKGFTRSKEGVLPLVINGIGKPLKDYDIEGNIYQSDVLSPDTPQEVKGCGERTGNLFDYKKYFESTFTKPNEWFEAAEIQLKPFTTYTFSTSYPEYGTNPIETPFIITTSTETPTTNNSGLSSTRKVTKTTEADGIIQIHKRITGGGYYPKKEDFDSGESWLMINEGSTPLPYEPYGYKVDVECRGKNLFDISTIEAGRIDDNGEVGYISQTSLAVSGNTITFSTTSSWRGFVSDYIEINGVIPIISYGSFTSNENAILNGFLHYYDADKQYLGNTSEHLPNTKYVRISFQSDVIVTNAVVSDIQVELGTEATSYEPYHEPITTPLYLDSPLYKIGDYSDRIGMTEEVRVIKELVLTGEENWVNSSAWKGDSTSVFYVGSSDIIAGSTSNNLRFIMSNYFVSYSRNELYNNDVNSVALTGSNAITIRISDSIATTVNDFKSYLAVQYSAGTPVTVYYVLAEPEIKALEPIEIPTLNGTTVIDVDVNMEVKPSNMWVEYKSSTSEYNPITLRTIDNQVLYTADNEILQTRR